MTAPVSDLDLEPLFNQARARLENDDPFERMVLAAPEAILHLEQQRKDLVTLVRFGFLVHIGGQRATVDSVGNPEMRELLLGILQAKSTADAVEALR